MTLMRRTCLGKQNKATIGEFPEHNLITVSNKAKMPYSNLFPKPFRGYYRSFWWSAREEIWSSSSGAVCCSEPTPRDPLCDSQDLSSLLPFNSKYLFVSIVHGRFLREQKPSRFLFFLQMQFGGKACVRSAFPCENMPSIRNTVAAEVLDNCCSLSVLYWSLDNGKQSCCYSELTCSFNMCPSLPN